MTKRKLIAGLLSCVALLGWGWFPAFAGMTEGAGMTETSSTPHIIIGEVAWAGSSLSTADEWLELWNLDATDANIGGWTLTGASAEPIILPATATIPGLGVFLISNYSQSEAKSVLATTSQMVTTAVALSNSALQITLSNASGTTVDIAGDGNAPSAGLSGTAKISMRRGVTNGIVSAWLSATKARNLKPDAVDLGTPGFYDGQTMSSSAEVTTTSLEAIQETNIQEVSATTTIETTTSTLDVEILTTVPTVPEEKPAPRIPDAPPKPNYRLLRLNEIAPAPTKGKEWIEIVSLDLEKPIPLAGCAIHDAQGRILLLKQGTIQPGQHLVLRLSRTVLANTGESVSLYAPDGTLIDTYRYTATKKDASWIRFPDILGDWQRTNNPTPGKANASSPASVDAPSAHATSSQDMVTAAATTTIEIEDIEDFDANVMDKDIEEETPTAKTPNSSTKSSKKTTTKTVATKNIIHPFTFDMLSSLETDSPLRIRLRGIVGTPPKLIKSKTFVLHAPDGRGILVTATTDRKLPTMGQTVTVTGRLTTSDDGASLKFQADDSWQAMNDRMPTSTSPRAVDLLAPSSEDFWSLTQATGTVKDVKGRKIYIDVDGIDAEITLSTRIPYRPQRLKKGDTLLVTGILAPATDMSRIYPRTAEDITILQRATVLQPTAEQPHASLPFGPWTPVGATIGAIGAAEGAKRLHKKRKQKLLEKKAAIPPAYPRPL